MSISISGGKKYLIVSALLYIFGYLFFLNTTIDDKVVLSFFLFLYFGILPVLYVYWIVLPESRNWYTTIFIFFISSLAVKISFPEQISIYFEDIYILRFFVILFILVINARILFSISKNISHAWKSRNDPRFELAKDKDKKNIQQQKIEMLLASELVNWYYFLGRTPLLNKNYYIVSKSQNFTILCFVLVFTGILSLYCFAILYTQGILIAIGTSIFILYAIPMIVANYRIAKHDSIYIKGNYLIINNAIWAISAIHISSIKAINISNFSDNMDGMTKKIGKTHNIEILLKTSVTYHGFMGQLPKKIMKFQLHIWNEDLLKKDIEAHFEFLNKRGHII